MNKTLLNTYQQQMKAALENILHFWMHYTKDATNGGFYGKVNNDNEPDIHADKGVVMHARILWTFAAAFRYTHNKEHKDMAKYAYDYLLKNFKDETYGGVYWSIDAAGKMKEGKKQIYGLAFVIYALSEWHAASNDETALEVAIHLYQTIEEHSFDPVRNGYEEAFTRDWQPILDLRLSAKDVNEKKTMNTHLHIIEAYANLYKQWPDAVLKEKIINLLHLFDEHFIDKSSAHLRLFFDEQWKENDCLISYGHDIEASWLLQQCAEITGENHWIAMMQQHALQIAKATLNGLDTDGGLWYEYDKVEKHLIKEKHSWPQAEAMIGFMNAYQLTRDEQWLQHTYSSWQFVENNLLDKANGEWFWGVDAHHHIMADKDKAGFWKCPYHNSRACLELIARINQLVSEED